MGCPDRAHALIAGMLWPGTCLNLADFVDLVGLLGADWRDSVFASDLAWRWIDDGNPGGTGWPN